jgi:hypothetical protein
MKKHIETFEERTTNEAYSSEDMKRGEELGKSSFGLALKFPKDYRREKLIIKKLVRLKSQITNPELKAEVDHILDMLEGTDDSQGAF